MKFVKLIILSSIVSGCTAEPETFRLGCTDAEGRFKQDILTIDTGEKVFRQLSGSGLTLPILDVNKTDSEIKLTLDSSPIKELAKKESNGGRLDGITYVAEINRATLAMSLQRYKDGKPYKKPQLKAKCRLVENKI